MMLYQKAVIGGILVASVSLGSRTAVSQEPVIYKVEERWEMVVNQPESANNSPQVTFFASPSVNNDGTYFQLQMNYAADEGYEEGGFHVAAVSDDDIVDEARSDTHEVLSTDEDLIRWTGVMAIVNNKALFAVRDGHGIDWGNFGGPDYLVQIVPSPVTDLSEYSPQHSLDNVDIGFGANRVSSIRLIDVKVFYTDGTTITVPLNVEP